MKVDIENKILIPFMVLSILSITILGIVSFWNGYQLLSNEKIKNIESSLGETIAYIETLDQEIDNDGIMLKDAKEKARKYFEKINKENMIILEGSEYIINNSTLDAKNLESVIANTNTSIYNKNNFLFLYGRYENWDWTIIFGINKILLLDELINIQKNILLIAIIFLVLSMQSAIFVAHSISKPIKKFAQVCKKIELNNLKEKIDINRSDEIGVLANSFNNMIDQLNISTEELIEIKKFNEDILKNISIGIMTTDKNGKLLSLNETGKKILEKYNNNKDICDSLNKQITQTIDEKRNINTVIANAKVLNGKTIYFDVSTSLLKKESNSITGAICSFNDITRRKSLENNIVRVDRLASVGQFAAGLAHEIRNPLTGIKTSIQVIKNRIVDTNKSSSLELIEGVIYEIDRINHLITQLLDFSKPKQSNYEKANILDLLSKSLDMTKESINKKNILVHSKTYCKQFSVFVDKGQVEQIFINIIKNAVDAMESNGVLYIIITTISIEKNPFILIGFRDNGCGMDEETMKKVFDPFFTTKAKGTGLGLSVVSKLVEENNGKLEVKSIKNRGTKFKVFLPLYSEDKNEN